MLALAARGKFRTVAWMAHAIRNSRLADVRPRLATLARTVDTLIPTLTGVGNRAGTIYIEYYVSEH